jgi:spore coat polysaccharide biosynthesis protein SpsF
MSGVSITALPKIVVVVQARSGSTRLPGKILKHICGKPVLILQLERILAARTPFQLVVATTTDSIDDPIEEICKEHKIICYRGHPTDLLDRHYKAALQFGAEAVVKIPSDCPLIDPAVIDKVLNFYLENQDKYDFVSNLHPATYPDGNDVEIMPFKILEIAFKEAQKDFEREHTTPFIWDQPERFRIGNVVMENGQDLSMTHRFTIDYIEDYEFIKAVYDELYEKNKLFSLKDILDLLERRPDIKNINKKYCGVNWYRKNINELKTINLSQTKIID